MLKVSDNFKKSCNSDNLKYREFIIIDNKEIDIKGNLSATAYKDTTFFGKFNLKMLTFETENDIDYKEKEFVYYKEVDGESIKIGTFIVTEIKDSDTFESVNVTAYDYGLNFANPYKSKLNYKSNKITMLQVAQEICANCGVELENTSLPNGDFIVDDNQFINDEQFGDVVCLIALENGTFATINENDKLEFIFKKETEGMTARLSTEDSKDLLTEDDNYIVVSDMDIIDDYVDLDDKRDTRPITCVLVATNKDLEEAGAIRKDQSLIDKYGENWLKIYDYAFAYSSEKCEKLVDAIFNQVKGFGYSSFETNYSFKPYLQLGDEIKFRNKNGDLVKSVILRIESNYDEIKLSAPSIINASVEYDLPQSTEELVKGAMISVNRANAEIKLNTDAISQANASIELNSKAINTANSQIVLKANAQGKIVQVKLESDASAGSTFTIDADQIDLNATDVLNILSGNTINLTSKNIKIDSTNFKVDKDGNMNAKSGSFNGTVNTDKDLTVGNNAYIGQNQTSDFAESKFLYFSDNTHISRRRIGKTEALRLNAEFIINYGQFLVYDNDSNIFHASSEEIYMAMQPSIGSDKRLKKNIKNIDASFIDNLKVKEFEYKSSPNKKQIGLIAQDYIDKDYSKYFLDEFVDDKNKKYYSIAYGNINNALIQYCQEMKQEIKSLQNQINELKEMINNGKYKD